MPQNTVANQYYEAERILDEKTMGDSGIFYLIKWKGMDQSGKPWEPTWEPARHCTQPLIASWERNRVAVKRKFRSSSIPSSPLNNPLKNSPSIKRERKHQKIAGLNYGTPPANVGNSVETPMVIDSDDDTIRNTFYPSLSKLNLVDSSSSDTPTLSVKNVKIQRQLLHPYHILLPVPLTKLQQIAYRRTIDKPQFFKYLAETNLATPPELDSIVFQTKDNLLKIVNHLSLLLSSVPGHSQGTNVSYQTFEKMGKLVMMYHLLNGLRNCELTLGIAIPQGPIMNNIIKDFMKKHNLNFSVLNETANNKLLKETSSSNDKLSCIVFTTPLPKMSEGELPQFDLVIAYDTSFNRKKHLLHTKTNENIPIIRLVTKNTLEHAINYQMSQNQDDNFLFSDLSLFEMKRILTFGLWKKNQCVEAGCELSKFDIQGTCDKVFKWINDGMLRNLSFGMEAAVEKVWGKTIPPEHVAFDKRLIGGSGGNRERKDLKDVTSAKAEKRVSEVSDEGSLKRRKDKEVAQNDDDNFQKKKKLKVIEEAPIEVQNSCSSSINENKILSLATSAIPTILSPTEPLTESPIEQINPMSLNKVKQTQSLKNSRDDSKDSRRNSLKESSKDSYIKSRDSTQDTFSSSSSSSSPSINKNSINRECNNRNIIKDSNKNVVKSCSKDSIKSNKDLQSVEENTLEWKQKYMELLTQTKLQDEKIENLTQEKDKYRKTTNELSSELAKTRNQLSEMQAKRKRTLLEVQSIELDKVRMEMADVQLENSRLKSDSENRDQEVVKLRKEMESLKSSSKAMKSKIKSLELENQLHQQTRLTSNSKSKRNESLEDQIQKLEDKNTTLQLQYRLKEQELKLALDDVKYHQDITELLLQMKGKTKEEMDAMYSAKRNSTQSKSTLSDTHSCVDEKDSDEIKMDLDIQNVPVVPVAPPAVSVAPAVPVVPVAPPAVPPAVPAAPVTPVTPVVENNINESSSINNTKTVSNGSKLSTSPFMYFDKRFNELSGPPIASVISTSSSFTCDWDSCKKGFEKKADLKSHLKCEHKLDPSCYNNVIEIND